MIRVAFWADTVGSPVATGTKTFLSEVLSRIGRDTESDIRLTLWYSASAAPGTGERLREAFGGDRVVVTRVPVTKRQIYMAGLTGQRLDISDHIGSHEVFFSGSHWPLGRNDSPFVAIFYDLAPLDFATSGSRWKQLVARWAFRRAVRVSTDTATACASISEFTADDIARRFDVPRDRIRVIPLACDVAAWAAQPDPRAWVRLADRWGLGEPYFLTLGGHVYRKNLRRLVSAFARMRAETGADVRLVLAGAENDETRRLRELVQELGIEEHVVMTGRLSHEEAHSLMHHARAFVFPSLSEGFGLPILEAMAAGTPVACSSATSLPEVGGRGVVYFDPLDEGSIASVLGRLLTDLALCRELTEEAPRRLRLFSWEQTAHAYAELIREVAGRTKGGTP